MVNNSKILASSKKKLSPVFIEEAIFLFGNPILQITDLPLDGPSNFFEETSLFIFQKAKFELNKIILKILNLARSVKKKL